MFPWQLLHLITALQRKGGVAHVLLLTCRRAWRFSLRNWWQLLCSDWTVGHHVSDALAEMAPFWLRWQLAFFGVMVRSSTVEASGNDAGKQRCYLHTWPLEDSQHFEINRQPSLLQKRVKTSMLKDFKKFIQLVSFSCGNNKRPLTFDWTFLWMYWMTIFFADIANDKQHERESNICPLFCLSHKCITWTIKMFLP